MKVVFVKYDGNIYSLTIGKSYTVIDKQPNLTTSSIPHTYPNRGDYVYIQNDSGYYWWYPSNSFKTIDEVRQEKLEQLGI
jgi:hypothetical protein